MKNEKVSITFGGSNVEGLEKDGFAIECEFALVNDLPPLTTAVAKHGVASLLYRGGASKILRELFPKGTKSTDVAYSDALAAKITVLLSEWFGKGCPAKRGEAALPEAFDVSLTVTRYVFGEGQEKSRAKAKEWLALLEPTEKWATVLEKFGFNEDTSHVGGEFNPLLVAKADEQLAKVRTAKREAAKKAEAAGMAELDNLFGK